MADFEILGIVEVQRGLEEAVRRVWNDVAAALEKEAQRVLELAQKRTPVKTGALRDSGQVHPAEITRDGISVTISFGTEAVMYAIVVHESLHVRHLNGEAKFLEKTMLEQAPSVMANIASMVRL